MTIGPRPASTAAALIRSGLAMTAAPWTRYMLTEPAWADLADRLLTDPLPLVTLWADGDAVHALFLEGQDAPLLASVPVVARRYQALSHARPAIAVCERIIRDLWGVEAMGARDLRPWLDHGHWGLTAPLSPRPGPAPWPPEPPEFVFDAADEKVGAFQLGLGPVQSVVAGPAHLRLTLDGERIRRLEPLLGYGHRGILALIRGRTPEAAASLVARIDAEATVAHQCAFARAIEAALRWPMPAGLDAVRLTMTELERIAMHLQHLGRVARCAGLEGAARRTASIREFVLAACAEAFGQRLMMDVIVPGGLSSEPRPGGLAALSGLLDRLEIALPALRRMFLDDAALGRRRGDSGHDAWGHARIRLDLIGRGIEDTRRLLAANMDGPVRRDAPPAQYQTIVEGVGVADSVHGPVWHWVRLQEGIVTALHVHDPVLPLWAVMEREAQGLRLEDLPLLCASVGLSSAGVDQ